jgi:DNA-binding HxlR family transcriptional regulator
MDTEYLKETNGAEMEPFVADVYSPTCPSRVALDRIGDRWTALIVGVLEDGPRRFGEIRDAMGITPKVLTQTLRTLERDGLVERRAHAEIPPRVEYSLTPLGMTLAEPLAAIRDWAESHIHEIIAAREQNDGRGDHELDDLDADAGRKRRTVNAGACAR